jgi:hypothetical protein
MKKILLIVLLGNAMFSSCTQYKLISSAYSQGTNIDNGNLFYYLPKTLLKAKVTYITTVRTTIINGVSKEELPEYEVRSVEITPLLVNDMNKGFLAHSDGSHNFFLTENSSVKFNQFGVMESLQSSLEDKTLQTAENVLKGVANIATFLAVAGPDEEPFLQDIREKIKQANSKLVTAIRGNNEKEVKKIKGMLLSYYELLKQYYENNKVLVAKSEVSFEFLVDPELGADIDLKPNQNMGSTIPTVVLKVSRFPLDTTNSIPATPSKSVGLIYRVPATCKVTATVTTPESAIEFFDNVMPISQFGFTATLPVTSKIFTSKKTTITFDQSTGTLSTVQLESGSSSENLSKSIANSTELIKNTVSQLKYDQQIDNLKKEKELKDLKESLINKPATESDNLQKQSALLKLELEIEKLKKELTEIKKP